VLLCEENVVGNDTVPFTAPKAVDFGGYMSSSLC